MTLPGSARGSRPLRLSASTKRLSATPRRASSTGSPNWPWQTFAQAAPASYKAFREPGVLDDPNHDGEKFAGRRRLIADLPDAPDHRREGRVVQLVALGACP